VSTDSSNVRVAGSGEIAVAATTATAPTDTGALPTGFVGLGYLSEDGFTEARERSVTDIPGWQNGDTVRSVVTDANLTYSFRMIETKKETVELYYGTTVTQSATNGNYVIVPSSTGGRQSFILDVIDGSELKRIYVPQGEITETGEMQYSRGVPIGYEVTLKTYADSGIGGNAEVWDTALKTGS
jgi:hypothetical protein